MAELSQLSIQLLEWKESIPRKSDLSNDFFDQSFRIYSHATIALFTVAIVAQRVALQTQFKFKKCTWSALF